MRVEHVLVFSLLGDFAHFRMRYTTSSSSTHMVPPRHTIAGIIGAILGVASEDLAQTFHPDVCKIGIVVSSPLSTLRVTYNQPLIKGDVTLEKLFSYENKSQIPYHLIKNPNYTIYFTHDNDGLYDKLKSFVQNHECIYPPSLGLAQLLCDFRFIEELTDIQKINPGSVSTRSVAPLEFFNPFPNTNYNHMVMDRMSRHLDEDRKADKFFRVIFDINGIHSLRGEYEENNEDIYPLAIDYNGEEEVVFLW